MLDLMEEEEYSRRRRASAAKTKANRGGTRIEAMLWICVRE